MDEKTAVTTEELVLALADRLPQPDVPAEDIWLYGRKRGWLSEQDQLLQKAPLERRHAARIVHEFLRIEYGEPDERDWSLARKYEDLFHCRVCAKHVAQVIVKDLMTPKTEKRFGLLSAVTVSDMEELLRRIDGILLERGRNKGGSAK